MALRNYGDIPANEQVEVGATPSAHTHAQSDVTSLSAALTAKADLVGGTVPLSQLPTVGTHNSILFPVGLGEPINTTAATAFVSATSYFSYLGRLGSAITTIDLLVKVTTAVATITWAEVAVFKGTPVLNGNASLTRCGFTNVATTFNSLGVKKTTVSLSGLAAGDDIWACLGSQATTPYQVRGLFADELQTGVVQSAAVRPSLAASPQATTLVAAALVPAWVIGRI